MVGSRAVEARLANDDEAAAATLPITMPTGVDRQSLDSALRYGSMAPGELLRLFDGGESANQNSDSRLALDDFGSGHGPHGADVADWLLAWGEIDLTQDLDGLDARADRSKGPLMSVLESSVDRMAALERVRSLMNDAVAAMNGARPREAAELFAAARSVWLAGEIETELWRGLRRAARQRIDVTSLLELAKNPFERMHLRQFLRTFPEWRVQPLLRRLGREPSRRIRHQLLTLLTVHGWDTRKEAADRLVRQATDRSERMPWYMTRNLIYLLRSLQQGAIARQASGNDYELAGVLSFAELSQPAPILFEAIGYLGRSADPRSQRRLLDLLADLEPRRPSTKSAEGTAALYDFVSDRLLRRSDEDGRLQVLKSLVRSRQSASFSVVECLASENLEGYPRLLKRLIEIAEERARRQWFGLRRGDHRSCHSALVALSSTDTPAVRQLLSRLSRAAGTKETRKMATTLVHRFDQALDMQERARRLLGTVADEELGRTA
jgi:hypothetical protein